MGTWANYKNLAGGVKMMFDTNNTPFLIFANADKNGEIIDAITGYNIIPDKQYQYFFFRKKPIDIERYKIVDGKLVEK